MQQPVSRTSSWAIASAVCSLVIFCPLATMLGPALGVKALADIRSRPGLHGTGFAVAGIVIGLLATAGWIGLAMWWHTTVREPILAGPEPELQAGFRGDIAGFKRGFHGQGAELADEHAIEFINELTRRYGVFLSMSQAEPDPDAAPPEPGTLDTSIPYVLTFDGGLVTAEAEFVAFDGSEFVGKWRSITIMDDERGELRYPPE